MDRRQLPEDFKKFINSLNCNNVSYLLVGGWAVGIYGYPRAKTKMPLVEIGTLLMWITYLEKAMNKNE